MKSFNSYIFSASNSISICQLHSSVTNKLVIKWIFSNSQTEKAQKIKYLTSQKENSWSYFFFPLNPRTVNPFKAPLGALVRLSWGQIYTNH